MSLRAVPLVDFFFFQAEDGIRDLTVTGVQTCALPVAAAASAGCGSDMAVPRRLGGNNGRRTRAQTEDCVEHQVCGSGPGRSSAVPAAAAAYTGSRISVPGRHHFQIDGWSSRTWTTRLHATPVGGPSGRVP